MPERAGGSARGAWLGVFALALGIRLFYLWQWHDTALFSTPIGDARAYLDWAREIAGGDWLGHEVFYQAPLYPYFLAVVLRLCGSETWGPRLVQALGGALAGLLLGRAAEGLFSRRVGLAAGVGLALYAPAVYFDGLIQKPALDGLLLAALLFALARSATPPSVGRAAVAGALLGLLALSRENALALAPVVALWLALLPGAAGAGARASRVLALGLGLSLVLVPVGLRNRAFGDRFLVTTAQLGPNLWIGNHAGASGRYEPLRPNRGSARFEREDARALAEAALGRPLSPGEVSDYWRDRALAFMRAEPAAALALLARKLGLIWNAVELPDTEGIEAYAEASWLLRALFALFNFGWLVPLAAVGALSARDWRRLWLLPALALALAASTALFYVFARYRYGLVPVLMPLAAAGAVELSAALRAGAALRAAGLGAAALALALAVRWPLAETNGSALTHFSAGAALLEAGKLAEAQAELERAVAAQPAFAPAQSRLADVLRKRGEPAAALAAYERALRLDPSYADAHAGEGIALDALGRREEALAEYRRALALDPNHPDANNNLANALFDQGQASEALARYRTALAARPDDADFAVNYAAALARTGDLAGALGVLDPVVAREPRHAAARLNRAAILEALGRTAEARADFAAVIASEPEGSAYAHAAQSELTRLGAP
ncbi:MAG TPA: tetratricopeptide repeat protein [Myxococcota bacterium]|nr:tetratricopeptide repeat protein [Myxococcota bacterium]